MDLKNIKNMLVRLIDLIAFDVCHRSQAYWEDDADPITKILNIPLRHEIPKELHTNLRKAIKSTLLKEYDCYSGYIRFGKSLTIKVYFKNLRKPAFDPNLSPREDG